MKTNLTIAIIASVLLMGLVFSTITYKKMYEKQKTETENVQKQLTDYSFQFSQLVESFQSLSKQKTYSISLAPTIDTKVTSTFGSTKYITLQYFFTMDGNKMELKPDSVYALSKEIN